MIPASGLFALIIRYPAANGNDFASACFAEARRCDILTQKTIRRTGNKIGIAGIPARRCFALPTALPLVRSGKGIRPKRR